MVNERRTMTYSPDWDEFCKQNDLELRKIVAYWLNHNHYKCVDADHEYTRGVWADVYIIFKLKGILTTFDPAIAPIHTYMWHCIKNAVMKVECAKFRKKRPLDYSEQIADDQPQPEDNNLNYRLDINQFIHDVQGYTCMEIPIKVMRTVFKYDRATAARYHRISKYKVSCYLGRIRSVYREYCAGNTGIEFWKREI